MFKILTPYKIKPLLDMGDIQNRAEQVGSKFFSPGTVRFFRSRVSESVYPDHVNQVTYFITSEQFNRHSSRRYTVRKIDWTTGRINTTGDHGDYNSLRSAKRAAESFATAA